MPFKDSLSKFAKSVGDGAASAAKKSGDLMEVTKLNFSIQTEEEKIKNVYTDIGKIIYNKFQAGENVDAVLIENCHKVDDMLNNISEIKKKIAEIKNIKFCQSCGTELTMETEFCSKCGAKQEKEN